MAHSYDIGTRAWQPDPTEGWVASELTDKTINGSKARLVFQLDNGETKTVEVNADALATGSDPALPPLMNPAMLEASDDLTNLSHLNEPAVLQAIRLRYAQKEIYTYSGIVLIATNPFARVDSLYVPGMVQVYAGKQRATQAPHLFAIAEEAFMDMLRSGKNQTIVVSGESGAGKTVSAKYIMRYFATRESPDNPGTRSKKGPEAMSETEEQILATNPIMEAFGNAKTTRNDNSSRFGKYIEIMFDKQTNIIGAKIRTYLLERNSIFYQLNTVVVRDSVAKFIYSSLFDWLVETINRSLATDDVLNRVSSFIGVLDIYGFEHFAKNSFEQFCINYANEKLQQEFNQHVFKLEQEEYLKEQIDWTFIDFSDNQPCIDLIEGKMGILSLLDEESRLPMGTDDQFVTKLHHNYAADKHKFFKKPRFGKSAFTVCHYAIDVTYESEGFIEKNRDTVPDEHMKILRATSNAFLRQVLDAALAVREKDLASSTSNAVKPAAGRKIGVAVNRKPTLGGIFRSSLIELMNTINNTDVHYIRCIKPNEAKESWKFEGPMVLSQLRACGVLETVRISCAGYPTRWTYEEFALRYYMLVHSTQWTSEIKDMADAILTKALGISSGQRSDKYQLGLTKIFFRAAAAKGYLRRKEILETRIGNAALIIQRVWRSRRQMRAWRQYRKKIILIQSLWRGRSARREYKQRREEARDLKQISYKLENKVVELTQTLGSMKTQNKTLLAQVDSYESQLKSWKARHNALEARSKELQAEANQAGIAVARLQAMEDEMKKLQLNFEDSTSNIKRLQEEEKALRQSLRAANIELDQAREERLHVEDEKLSLRQQLVELRDQLEIAKRTPAMNGEAVNNGVINAPSVTSGLINFVSSKTPKRRSAGAEPREVDRFSATYNPRPVSMAVASGIRGQNLPGAAFIPGVDNIELELETLLADEEGLNEEVTMGLIRNLKIPSPNTNPPPSDKEVLFPSYLINLVTSEMWNNGFVKESERFLANVMQSIQQEVMQHDGDEAISPGAFWLSNVHEMLSFVFLAEDWYEAQKTDNYDLFQDL
ncbi:unnamed protein product [Parascedosporium putredinis]|uniref:Myosin-2 n=1 Tax=Parascedosporium putredinis TaxID=1442378 RepID=A0A9P1M5H8_9PEZI|nr:unnamed protein product [Parascedosporium putredinis]CAI7987265.1 unnamed protein product [Parascedosporium putredinis]